jgi:hypothetical protein
LHQLCYVPNRSVGSCVRPAVPSTCPPATRARATPPQARGPLDVVLWRSLPRFNRQRMLVALPPASQMPTPGFTPHAACMAIATHCVVQATAALSSTSPNIHSCRRAAAGNPSTSTSFSAAALLQLKTRGLAPHPQRMRRLCCKQLQRSRYVVLDSAGRRCSSCSSSSSSSACSG